MNLKRELYFSLNRYLKSIFGERVKKIPVDAGLGCPNRDGTISTGGCTYCDAFGSGTGLSFKGLSVEEQVKLFLNKFQNNRKFKKFIVYFQAFCNTYGDLKTLKSLYDVVFLDDRIVGLAIGTRPDCVNEGVLNLIKSYQKKGYLVWIELGLQSIHDETLKLINRGHTFEDFLKGYELVKSYDIPVVVHIIFGLPGETPDMMLQTSKTLAKLKPDGVKFHALYIVKGTKIAELYLKGAYTPISLETYVNLVATSIAMLPPQTVVHRVCSEASKEKILAPLWVSEKLKVVNLVRDFMKKKGLYQGKLFENFD